MSANASKDKILSLDEYRRSRLVNGPQPFDPHAVAQRIARVRTAFTPAEREIATDLALRDAEEMLQILGVMGGEIAAFRQQVKILAQQSADQATISSVLLAHAGGEVRMDAKWFADYEVTGGFSVTEEENEVVVRLIGVDDLPEPGVPLESANQQTEDA